MTPSTTESAALQALRSFLLAVLPKETEVRQTQANRVAEPEGDDFVMLTPIGRGRLSTNVETPADCAFVASAAGNVLTVASMITGVILAGALVQGLYLRERPSIVEQIDGTTGGVGRYRLSAAQSEVPNEVMQTGVTAIAQATELEVQLDVHGPASADNAQVVSTLIRSEFATTFFAEVADVGGVASPLHADDPRQAPFVNDQQQYENRWVVMIHLQVDPSVSVPQQFASAVEVDVVSVDVVYPP